MSDNLIAAIWHLVRHGRSDHDFLRSRDAEGELTQTCQACGYTRRLLGDDVIRDGPAHRFQRDLGAIRTKAKKVKPSKPAGPKVVELRQR